MRRMSKPTVMKKKMMQEYPEADQEALVKWKLTKERD